MVQTSNNLFIFGGLHTTYLSELESNDSEEQRIEQKLAHLQSNKLKYEYLEKQLQQSGEPQVSTTDADARALLVQGQVVEVAYNIEAAVDGKHKLVIGTHTISNAVSTY